MSNTSNPLSLTIEKKILLHSLDFLRYENEYEVPFEIAQEGIAQAIGIRRDNVPRATRRLKEEGLLSEKVVRVKGVKRKRKVYFLSPEGKQYALSIRKELEEVKVKLPTGDGQVITISLMEVNSKLGGNFRLLEIVNHVSSAGLLDVGSLERYKERIDTQGAAQLALGPELVEFLENAPKLGTFVGRQRELTELKKQLDSDVTSVLVISGMAGIGKTTLTVKLIQDYQGKRNLFWYRFHQWDTLRNTLEGISEFLYKIQRRRLTTYLASESSIDLRVVGRILEDDLNGINAILVFDDFQRVRDPIADLFTLFLELSSKLTGVHIIVLGRRIVPFYDRGEVLIKHMVFELQLMGLDENSARELIRITEQHEDLFWPIYSLTKGHPLFLGLIRNIEDIKKQQDIKRYIYEEIFSKLADPEKELLRIISVFRYPVSSQALFLIGDMGFETIDSLVEKCLVQEISYDNFDVHDLIREFFYIRLSSEERRSHHVMAANYYLEQQDDQIGIQNAIEASYHFLKAGQHEKAIKILLGSSDDILKKGFISRCDNMLDKFTMENLPKEYWAQFMLLKANVSTRLGVLEDALGFYDQALLLAEREKDDFVRALSLRKKGHILLVRGQRDEALKSFKESLKISQRIKDMAGIGDAFRGLGRVAQTKGEFKEASAYHEKAISHAQKVGDLEVLGKTYVDLGTVVGNMGDHDGALKTFKKSMDVLNKMGDQYGMARVANNMGVVLTEMGRFDDALVQFEECISMSENTGDIRQQGYGLASAAEIMINKDEMELAEDYLVEAEEIFQKLGEKFKMANIHCQFGMVERKKKHYPKAVEFYKKGLEELEKLHLPYHYAKELRNYGYLLKEMGDIKNANQVMTQANKIFTEIGVKAK